MATDTELGLAVALIEKVAARLGIAELQPAAAQARQLFTGINVPANAAARPTTEAEILALADRARDLDLASRAPGDTSKQAEFGMIAVVILAVVMVACCAFYLWRVGPASVMEAEGIRPLLVFMAIFSTVTFGGALIMASLFSSDGTFEERFRRAREIFLVFSGVFGTVLGFYFGAPDGKGPGTIAVNGAVEGTEVVAIAVGGIAPYKFTLTYGEKNSTKEMLSDNGRGAFTLNRKTDKLDSMKVTVKDAKGAEGSFTFDKGELKENGWTATEDSATTPTVAPTASPVAAQR